MVENHNRSIINALMEKNVDKVLLLIGLPGYDINFHCDLQKQLTPFMMAAKLGLYSVCEKFISLGAEIHCRDVEGRTVLHHACYYGQPDIVKLLLNSGARIHCFTYEGDHPIHDAVSSGNLDTLKALLEAGCDINRPNHLTSTSSLELAVLHGLTDVVSLLLEYGANVHHHSTARESAIHFAVHTGNLTIIRLLLSSGADINGKTYLGETPLALAIQEKKLDIIKFLVKSGCKIDSHDFLSPLCIACRQNSIDIIEYLLSEGYNVSSDDQMKRFTFHRLEKVFPKLLAYIYHRVENPLTLKESSRIQLRKCLQPNIQERIGILNVPKVLKDWLCEDNIYQDL